MTAEPAPRWVNCDPVASYLLDGQVTVSVTAFFTCFPPPKYSEAAASSSTLREVSRGFRSPTHLPDQPSAVSSTSLLFFIHCCIFASERLPSGLSLFSSGASGRSAKKAPKANALRKQWQIHADIILPP